MALNLLKLRRAARDLGATDHQADEFAESFTDVATKQDLRELRDQLRREIDDALNSLESRLLNRLILATVAIGGIYMVVANLLFLLATSLRLCWSAA